jgi:acyl-CoA thioesterase-1
MRQLAKFVCYPAAALLLAVSAAGAARAEPVKIVAIGSSNTNGVGVGAANAWPAQLERMLKNKGHDVAMTVSAINGETTNALLARAPGAIPPGTKVVIYQLSRDNDQKAGAADTTDQNAARMEGIIKARGAKGVRVGFLKLLGPTGGGNPNYQADGHHLTAASHQRLAARLMPMVIKAMGKEEKKG